MENIIIKVILTLSVFVLMVFSEENCENKQNGYYCFDETKFAWCYGQNQPATMFCAPGTFCLCGKSEFNPCGFNGGQNSVIKCEGKPGDFFGNNNNTKPDSNDKQDSDDIPIPNPSPIPPIPPNPNPKQQKRVLAYFTSWPQVCVKLLHFFFLIVFFFFNSIIWDHLMGKHVDLCQMTLMLL
jgi:hypothetical protein